jgi:hypothetical protein
MVDCVVCHYWSERLKDARSRILGRRVQGEEIQLTARLLDHQRHGACATRSPRLLRDLVKRDERTCSGADRPMADDLTTKAYVSGPAPQIAKISATEVTAEHLLIGGGFASA